MLIHDTMHHPEDIRRQQDFMLPFPVLHLTTESWNGAQITITHITD